MSIAGGRNDHQGSRPKRSLRVVAALVLAGIAAAAAIQLRGRAVATAAHREEESDGAETNERVSVEDLRRLKDRLIALDSKVTALELALAASVGAGSVIGAAPATAPTPVKAKDSRSPAELHQDTLRRFDDNLASDRGDERDRRTTADGLKRAIAEATQGKGQVMEVVCTGAFCRTTIEQDITASPPLDVGALQDAVPALRTESMFDYQTEGTRRRTIVYAAREGQLLPQERPAIADRSGAAAARPPDP